MRKPTPFWLLSLAGMLTACTAILNQGADQCSADTDCVRFGAQYTCSQGLCRDPNAPSSSSGSGGASSGNQPDGSTTEDGGCVPTPKTRNADFYNESCTNASCVPFDNCARLGLCDGAALPALVSPPDGGV